MYNRTGCWRTGKIKPLRQLVIEVPMLPPEQWSPNARTHWGDKYRAAHGKGGYSEAVFYCAVDARNRAGMQEPLEQANILVIFTFPEKRERDFDNLLARFKCGLDTLKTPRAITDTLRASIIRDDSMEHITLTAQVEIGKEPKTTIFIRERS